MQLHDKVVLVTGASRGVGAALARALGAAGAQVCVNYHRSEAAAQAVVADVIAAGGQAFAHQADVTDAAAVEAMVAATIARFGRLDAVINNALPAYSFDPSAAYTKLETIEWSHFQTQFEGAVKAAFNTARAAVPHMRARGYGKIVNIATNLIYNPVVTYHDYTAAKAAMVGLTRTLAAELGPMGIRVNLVAGGLLSVTDASKVTTPEVFQFVANGSPLRRVVTTEEFAQAVLFFVAGESDPITGQSIAVDGGLTMA
jgi:3-oxoacyl-[acyl-carrier protein] reductase